MRHATKAKSGQAIGAADPAGVKADELDPLDRMRVEIRPYHLEEPRHQVDLDIALTQ